MIFDSILPCLKCTPGLIVEGSYGLGAAVFTREGHPQWALSLTGVEFRFGAADRYS